MKIKVVNQVSIINGEDGPGKVFNRRSSKAQIPKD